MELSAKADGGEPLPLGDCVHFKSGPGYHPEGGNQRRASMCGEISLR